MTNKSFNKLHLENQLIRYFKGFNKTDLPMLTREIFKTHCFISALLFDGLMLIVIKNSVNYMTFM